VDEDNDLNNLVSRVASPAAAGQDVTDWAPAQAQPVYPASVPSPGYSDPMSSAGYPNAELLQNQINNNGSSSGSLYNQQQLNFAVNEMSTGSGALWSSQMQTASMALSSNNSAPSNNNNNNNNNNGPEWRLPQLPAIFDTKLERPPVQVRIGIFLIFILVCQGRC
jgi:hypothetical protein